MRAIPRVVATILTLVIAAGAGAGKRAPLDSDEVRKRSEKLPADLIHEIAGMQYVLPPDQLSELLSQSDPRKCRTWIDAWWDARDPVPTNAKNEARDEHERRVLTAQAEFGRGAWPGWDDRGEVYIRYGDPLTRALSGADVIPPGTYVPAGELWYYPQFNIYTQFAESGRFGYVQYQETVHLPPSERDRSDRRVIASEHNPDMHMDYMGYEFDIPGVMHAGVPLAGADYDNYLKKVYSYHDLVDQAPAVYPFDFSDMHIPAAVSVQSFRGGDGVDRVDVNTEFMSSTGPVKVSARSRRFITKSVFWDRQGVEIARQARVDSILTAVGGDSSAAVLNMLTVTLPPGAYKMAVTVEELGTKRFATARRTVMCHDMEGAIAMSDLLLARTIDVAREESAFNRGPLEVVPRPSGVYKVGESVPVYFEVYNIGVDKAGAHAYSVEYAVKPKRDRPRSLWWRLTRKKEEALSVRSSFETASFGPHDVVHVSAVTRNLWPGEFVLEVSVIDAATSKRVTRESTFRLK